MIWGDGEGTLGEKKDGRLEKEEVERKISNNNVMRKPTI